VSGSWWCRAAFIAIGSTGRDGNGRGPSVRQGIPDPRTARRYWLPAVRGLCGCDCGYSRCCGTCGCGGCCCGCGYGRCCGTCICGFGSESTVAVAAWVAPVCPGDAVLLLSVITGGGCVVGVSMPRGQRYADSIIQCRINDRSKHEISAASSASLPIRSSNFIHLKQVMSSPPLILNSTRCAAANGDIQKPPAIASSATRCARLRPGRYSRLPASRTSTSIHPLDGR